MRVMTTGNAWPPGSDRGALAAQRTQAVTLSRPFSVTVSPADLTRGLSG